MRRCHRPTTHRSPALAVLALAALLGLVGCGSSGGTGTGAPPASYADGAATEDGVADAGAADGAAADTAVADTGAATDSGAESDTTAFPDGFLEPLDAGADTAAPEDTGPVVTGPVGKLYAHTSKDLYELDLDAGAFLKKGTFSFDKNEDKITDIAVDKFGTLYAIGFDHVYTCATDTAKCIWLAKLPTSFNGMTFVPEGVVTPGKDALIGISDKGEWTHIDLSSGKVVLKKLGVYGGGWLSSGDAFSVVGVGTFATLKGKGDTDTLAKIDPKTGKIQQLLGETGAVGLFGLAWWKGVFYGFAKGGSVYELDIKTGKATEVKSLKAPKGVSWWGAGVSTRANGG